MLRQDEMLCFSLGVAMRRISKIYAEALAEHDIKVQDLGGEVEAIEISAQTGQGVDKLLETLTLMAEVENYQADPNVVFASIRVLL